MFNSDDVQLATFNQEARSMKECLVPDQGGDTWIGVPLTASIQAIDGSIAKMESRSKMLSIQLGGEHCKSALKLTGCQKLDRGTKRITLVKVLSTKGNGHSAKGSQLIWVRLLGCINNQASGMSIDQPFKGCAGLRY
jgi:hypothetical protein